MTKLSFTLPTATDAMKLAAPGIGLGTVSIGAIFANELAKLTKAFPQLNMVVQQEPKARDMAVGAAVMAALNALFQFHQAEGDQQQRAGGPVDPYLGRPAPLPNQWKLT